jgi:hypothetical protein
VKQTKGIMSETTTNTSYKLKAGLVEDDSGLTPEAGAIIFDKSQNTLIFGDGFNFLPLGPGATSKDAAATKLNTPGSQVLVAATPVAPITVYDTIVYTIGTTVTPTLGTTYTLTADGVIDVSNDFALQSSAVNTTVTIEVLVNGTPQASRVVNMAALSNIYQNAWVNNLSITNGDVITYRFTSDKNATITLHGVNIGIHYR